MEKLGLILFVIISVVSIHFISTATTQRMLNPDEFMKLLENHQLKSRFGGQPDKTNLMNKASEPSTDESTSTEELDTDDENSTEDEGSSVKNVTVVNRFLVDIPCNPPYRMIRKKCKKVYS
ncbi:unnamed protein product [Phyllotreta striolata]|uniref:Uncharacterized protein n=1 Tax=Phyllotreta striolata TaxID=444603 RepID=A0A9N9TEI2_PHYSR|nr:unnamed protein product [Phyllotreta striolata]